MKSELASKGVVGLICIVADYLYCRRLVADNPETACKGCCSPEGDALCDMSYVIEL